MAEVRDERDSLEGRLSTFLYYGYVPAVERVVHQMPWASVAKDPVVASLSEEEFARTAARALSSAVQRLCDAEFHVVSLSGGLDSRAILAELLNHVSRDSVLAVTVGTPGAHDYEIPARVAELAGVEHVRIDLTRQHLDYETLKRSARKQRVASWVLDVYYHRMLRETVSQQAAFWNGFLGGHITRSRKYFGDSDDSWEGAKRLFIKRNRFVHSARLSHPAFDPGSPLPTAPLHAESCLTPFLQLDLSIRQHRLIRNINCPEGFDNRLPFLDEEWVHLWMNAYVEGRDSMALYRRMLKATYPDFFSLPVKNPRPMPIQATLTQRVAANISSRLEYFRAMAKPDRRNTNRMVNYIDFARGLREREDLKELTRSSLQRLRGRKLIDWLDFERLWKEHQMGEANHDRALILLASLEMQADRLMSEVT